MKAIILLAALGTAIGMAVPAVIALAKVQTIADSQLRACIEQVHRDGTICDADDGLERHVVRAAGGTLIAARPTTPM
jgi:hypothetical protein